MGSKGFQKDITEQVDLKGELLEQEYNDKLKKLKDDYTKKLKKESHLNAIKLLERALKASRGRKICISFFIMILGVVLIYISIHAVEPYIIYGHAINRGPLHLYATFADGTQPKIEVSFLGKSSIHINIASHGPPLKSDKLILITDKQIKHRIPEKLSFSEKKVVLPESEIGRWNWQTCYIYEIDWEDGSVLNLEIMAGVISYSNEHYSFAMDLVNPSIWFGIKDALSPKIKYAESINLHLTLPKYFRVMNSTHASESFKIVQEDHNWEDLSGEIESTRFHEYSLDCGKSHFYAELISDYYQKHKVETFLFNGALLGVGLSITINRLFDVLQII